MRTQSQKLLSPKTTGTEYEFFPLNEAADARGKYLDCMTLKKKLSYCEIRYLVIDQEFS